MDIALKILRQPQRNTSPEFFTYHLSVPESTTILDCLNQIKWQQDGSLAFRKNCRNTICGSCAVGLNGRAALACKENVGQEVARLRATTSPEDGIPQLILTPLNNLPVIKDLVVEMASFWQQLEEIQPYVQRRSPQVPEREFHQSPQEREALNPAGDCILCGACYSECNAVTVNPNFVGPHALAKAERLLADSRDDLTQRRLDQYHQTDTGVWACTRCYQCNYVCPQAVAPLDRITEIKSVLLHQKDPQTSRAIRHRKTLLQLVQAGGWVDERRFALMVMGLQSAAEIFPLGWRMLWHGKFPVTFEASAGTAAVAQLMGAAISTKQGNSDHPVK
ncbi:succinate dehydrogenase/fumarate reductase iron-sulfur subunit [Synechococcus moorigangaii CMS01]|nr:succinate dehydrogenase/fumarate reductase iron-sulfur subunit [Synechococcus moorigangaii CMS01]